MTYRHPKIVFIDSNGKRMKPPKFQPDTCKDCQFWDRETHKCYQSTNSNDWKFTTADHSCFEFRVRMPDDMLKGMLK